MQAESAAVEFISEIQRDGFERRNILKEDAGSLVTQHCMSMSVRANGRRLLTITPIRLGRPKQCAHGLRIGACCVELLRSDATIVKSFRPCCALSSSW